MNKGEIAIVVAVISFIGGILGIYLYQTDFFVSSDIRIIRTVDSDDGCPLYFNMNDGTLAESIITKGRNSDESVQQVATFTGQAFEIPEDAIPILVLNEKYTNLLPDTAWVFDGNTTKYNVKGYSQGAFKKYENGKVVVFGEAAMFTAQLAGPDKRKMGMNREDARENYKLLLNIIHWLDGRID